MQKFLPGFKATFIIVGLSFVLLSCSLFAKGLITSMAQFKVPEAILQSPHYFDAILWVYIHMIVLGVLIVLLGLFVNEISKQKWIALILFLITTFYAYLDFRSSDSALGNGLYQGEASVAPAIIGSIVALLFLQLTIRMFNSKSGDKV